jgi:hypothetical protein
MNTNKTQTEQLTQDAVMQSVLKASDLRVGNLINVLNPNTGKWNIEATKGKTIMILQQEEGHYLLINNLKPIPLTEEWLIKLGFEWNDFDETYCKGRIRITKDFKTFVGLCLLPKKYFVHEIQNIFFSTENYELTVA